MLLVLVLLPTGLVLLRGIEWLLRHRFSFTTPERLLLGFYTAGAFVYVIASVPIAVYGATLLWVLFGAGAAAYVILAVVERGKGLRAVRAFALTPAGIGLAAGTLGLLVFEVLPVWNHPFPNAWDGSVTALWMNLTLQQGTLPTNLQPYAAAPVVYPLATTVWMTLPVLTLGWPLVQAPVLLPPLFLSLTVPAAYAWGTRWAQPSSGEGASVGLLFGGFFGLVASWPRFYTGGSYDFAFALPLFLVSLGWLPELVRTERVPKNRWVALGLLAGVLTSISLAAGEAFVVVLVALAIAEHWNDRPRLMTWLGRATMVVGFDAAFSLRSIISWAASHGPAYTTSSTYGSLDLRLVEGELDPWVPWKYKMSPFPGLSLELQILLVLGLFLAVGAARNGLGGRVPPAFQRMATQLLVGTAAMFLMTALLLPVALPGPLSQGLRNVTNLDQTSVLLFIFLAGLSLFPLTLALQRLTGRRQPITLDRGRGAEVAFVPHRWGGGRLQRVPLRRAMSIAAVLVLVVPLGSGAWFSVVQGPSFITQNVGKTSNVTAGDVAVMEWVGGHLPSCSSVLVAPGSAGQFLPEYATVSLVFPMNPVPDSLPYQVAVSDLTSGMYAPATKMALESLSVTEVMVTGPTSVGFLPFSTTPLNGSGDFSLLTNSADASLYEFVPVSQGTGCVP